MDILSLILMVFVSLVIAALILFVIIIISLIILYKQAKKHPLGSLIGLLFLLIISVIFGLVSFETIIGLLAGITGVIGSLIVLVNRWKYLKKAL